MSPSFSQYATKASCSTAALCLPRPTYTHGCYGECERGSLPCPPFRTITPRWVIPFRHTAFCVSKVMEPKTTDQATSIFVWQLGRLLQEEDAYPQKCKWTSYCSQVNHSCSGLRFWFAIGITSSDYSNDCYLTEDGGGKEGSLPVIIIIGSIK